MKTFIYLCAAIFTTASVLAQAPGKMSYQAVVRNSSNALVINQSVGMRISILQASANGSAIFVETHTVSTNTNGLASLEVGGGIVVAGNFETIDWANGPYFLKTETDLAGGSNYSLSGTSQLLSVPYALYAASAHTANNGVPTGGSNGQVLTFCNGIATWTTGGQCPGSIAALNCGSATSNGTLSAGTAASGVSVSIPYTAGNGGAHSGQTVASTGVTGLMATLPSGSFANGSGTLTYSISGTPSTSGTANFALNVGGQSCTLSTVVNSGGTSGSSTATCGANNVHNSNLTYGSMTDQDGNAYKTILIGTQEWMAENLKASHYRNGEMIPLITNTAAWSGLTSPATCWYNNDSAASNCPYGKLYNWFVVSDLRNVCPLGWHIPTDAEWNNLIAFLDPSYLPTATGLQSNTAGGKLKTTGTQFWSSPNSSADNSSGFSGLPGGYRNSTGSFLVAGENGLFWSSSEFNINNGWYHSMNFTSGNEFRNNIQKRYGLSVRCLRD